MIFIVSINFISFDAGSMSCFKTIQPINFMLFCFWLLLDLTTWVTTISVHYDTKYGSQAWVQGGCLLILQQEPFLLHWFLKIPLMATAKPKSLPQLQLWSNPGWMFVSSCLSARGSTHGWLARLEQCSQQQQVGGMEGAGPHKSLSQNRPVESTVPHPLQPKG